MRHLPATTTDPNVLVGLDTPDDAGVYLVAPGVAIIQTVDFFTPIVDDPFTWGEIAAANALSDVYAMGGRPRTAMNLVGWPRELDFEILGAVVAGGAEKCGEAGVTIIGGHSVDDPEPKFGLAVTGVVDPAGIVRTRGSSPGSELVLTKGLGTGVISSAIKEQQAPHEAVAAAIDSMRNLNEPAAAAMLEVGVEAATDVTGFGLMGHLREMLGERLDAMLDLAAIPILPGAVELARRGILPGGSKRNIESVAPFVDTGEIDAATRAVLFDAQTSGGMLIAVTASKSQALLGALEERGVDGARRIGSLVEGSGRIEVTT
jgi:selenide, water dikinase